MADATTEQLRQAHTCIKQGDKQQAAALLMSLLKTDKTNANAWWLLANAIGDPQKQRQALNNVLKLRPGDERAATMLKKLDAVTQFDELAGLDEDYVTPPKPAHHDEFDDLDDASDPFAGLDADDTDPFADVPTPPKSKPTKGKMPAGFTPLDTRPSLLAESSDSLLNNPAVIGSMALGVVVILIVVIALVVVNGGGLTGGQSSATCESGSPTQEGLNVECGSVAFGDRVTGQVNESDVHIWYLELTGPQDVIIEVNALDRDLDPIVTVFAPGSNTIVADNDDVDLFNGNLNSRVAQRFSAPGIYRIGITCWGISTGRYELIVRHPGA